MKGNLNWGNATATMRWNHIYNGQWFSNTSAIFTNYQLGIGSKEKFDDSYFDLQFTSAIRDYTIKHDFDYFPNNKHHVRIGATTIFHRFRPSAVVVKGSDLAANLINVTSIFSNESGLTP